MPLDDSLRLLDIPHVEDCLLRIRKPPRGADIIPGECLLPSEGSIAFRGLQESHPTSLINCRIAVGEEGDVMFGLPAQSVQPDE